MSDRYCRGLACALGLLALSFASASCRRTPAPSKPNHAPSNALQATATAEKEARHPGTAPEETPLLIGPSPANVSSSEREQRLTELFNGRIATDRLPVVDTDPGVPNDDKLHARLTRVVADAPAGKVVARVDIPKLLSGTLDQERANRVTASMSAGFRSCYKRALASEGRLPYASFDLEMLVNVDGSVGSVKIEGKQDLLLSDFFTCAKARAQASVFEPAPTEPSRLRFAVIADNILPGTLASLAETERAKGSAKHER